MKRDSKEYRLAERVIHLENALKTANQILNENGLLGVLPDFSVSFHEAPKFHSKVRKELKNTMG